MKVHTPAEWAACAQGRRDASMENPANVILDVWHLALDATRDVADAYAQGHAEGYVAGAMDAADRRTVRRLPKAR